VPARARQHPSARGEARSGERERDKTCGEDSGTSGMKGLRTSAEGLTRWSCTSILKGWTSSYMLSTAFASVSWPQRERGLRDGRAGPH
jgi:hypothetical protein